MVETIEGEDCVGAERFMRFLVTANPTMPRMMNAQTTKLSVDADGVGDVSVEFGLFGLEDFTVVH